MYDVTGRVLVTLVSFRWMREKSIMSEVWADFKDAAAPLTAGEENARANMAIEDERYIVQWDKKQLRSLVS